MKKLLLGNRPFFVTWFLLLLAVSGLMLRYTKAELIRWVNEHFHPAGDLLFQSITHLGDGAFFVFVVLVLAFRSFRYAVMGLASFLLSTLVAQGLKHYVFPDNLRPSKFFENSGWNFRTIEGLDLHSFNSFPSGHTTSAFALFCLLALLDERKGRGWFFALLAAAVGYSRVYLFQHFVEDAYAGALIGVTSTVVVYLLFSPRWERSPKAWHDRRFVLPSRRSAK
ncbi:phosphatase PAP2 family protein [Tellurirhabdus rosea]|uniref:phosphatase PAP2 family protein n=1 Tax=Tellurirhabdus rosea TaxID=2674997 RepID=UPI00225693BB|nr:phosphatase PAP2 family protein [Tellurirhabdus rosea]